MQAVRAHLTVPNTLAPVEPSEIDPPPVTAAKRPVPTDLDVSSGVPLRHRNDGGYQFSG